MTSTFAESTVEEAALELFADLGYSILHGPDIAPGEMFAERTMYSDVVLAGRLREALKRINPKVPGEAIEEAIRKVLHSDSPNLVASNRRFHQFLTDGVPVEYKGKDRVIHDQLQLVDFKNPANNDWVARSSIHGHREPQ